MLFLILVPSIIIPKKHWELAGFQFSSQDDKLFNILGKDWERCFLCPDFPLENIDGPLPEEEIRKHDEERHSWMPYLSAAPSQAAPSQADPYQADPNQPVPNQPSPSQPAPLNLSLRGSPRISAALRQAAASQADSNQPIPNSKLPAFILHHDFILANTDEPLPIEERHSAPSQAAASQADSNQPVPNQPPPSQPAPGRPVVYSKLPAYILHPDFILANTDEPLPIVIRNHDEERHSAPSQAAASQADPNQPVPNQPSPSQPAPGRPVIKPELSRSIDRSIGKLTGYYFKRLIPSAQGMYVFSHFSLLLASYVYISRISQYTFLISQ